MYRSSFLPMTILLCAAGWFCVSAGIGQVTPKDEGTPAAHATEAFADDQVLLELQQIRRKLGGSVLRGTLLDSPELNEDLDASIRALGGNEKSGRSTQSESESKLTDAVRMIREHCTRMDRIANTIELQRFYRCADELRQSAHALRLVARQLDTPSAEQIQAQHPAIPAKSAAGADSSSSSP